MPNIDDVRSTSDQRRRQPGRLTHRPSRPARSAPSPHATQCAGDGVGRCHSSVRHTSAASPKSGLRDHSTTAALLDMSNYVMTFLQVGCRGRRIRGCEAVAQPPEASRASLSTLVRSDPLARLRDPEACRPPHRPARTDHRAEHRVPSERSPTRPRSTRVPLPAASIPNPTADTADYKTPLVGHDHSARATPVGTIDSARVSS